MTDLLPCPFCGSSDAMELADRLASMPAAEAIRGPRDWATIQSALRGVAQGAVSCGVTDQDKIETLQKLVAEYQASTIAGAQADVAAHGLPGARGRGEPDLDPAEVWENYISEVDPEHRSPQGALAFGFAAALAFSSTDREGTTVYLREVDAGTDSACWVVCNRVDAGAVAFVGAA